jgi:hypothetical protein
MLSIGFAALARSAKTKSGIFNDRVRLTLLLLGGNLLGGHDMKLLDGNLVRLAKNIMRRNLPMPIFRTLFLFEFYPQNTYSTIYFSS